MILSKYISYDIDYTDTSTWYFEKLICTTSHTSYNLIYEQLLRERGSLQLAEDTGRVCMMQHNRITSG